MQVESLDEATRKAIWDIFYQMTKHRSEHAYKVAKNIALSEYWLDQTIEEFEDENPSNLHTWAYSNSNAYKLDNFIWRIKDLILKKEYNKVFDLIELFLKDYWELDGVFNKIFEKYVVWYRLSATNEIIALTNEAELNEINNTQNLPTLSKQHFENAITEFSKREFANYKLVARESIDWIESLLRELVGDTKITLWQAINKIQSDKKYLKYTRLFDGLDKIWAFANDQLRHAEKNEESIIWFHDAKFILVLASSIANYIESIR